MPYNTKALKTDVSGVKPAPQHFDPGLDDYDVSLGRNGASRVELYGPDGEPLGTTSGKLAVRASEIETQLTAIQGYIDGLEGAIGEAQAAPTANTLLARLKNLETKVDAIIADGVKLSGSIPEYGWIEGDAEPTPTQFAFGAKINPTTKSVTSMYWNGIAWVEVV